MNPRSSVATVPYDFTLISISQFCVANLYTKSEPALCLGVTTTAGVATIAASPPKNDLRLVPLTPLRLRPHYNYIVILIPPPCQSPTLPPFNPSLPSASAFPGARHPMPRRISPRRKLGFATAKKPNPVIQSPIHRAKDLSSLFRSVRHSLPLARAAPIPLLLDA